MAFILTNIILGVGLAMDAFSISLANGLNAPCMKRRKMCLIAGVFAFFQALMPMVGWICVHTIVAVFGAFQRFIPWIALVLLGFIGGKMLIEGIRGEEEECEGKLSMGELFLQGIATSIDALSVGFAIAHYDLVSAITASLIISAVTFIICMAGVVIGKKAGTKLAGKAGILGGIILIAIGIEIFITGIF